MSTPEPTSLNPVQYAEDILDVHGPWDEAQRRLDLHAEASESVDETKRQIRAVKQEIEDLKRDIATVAPGFVDYPTSGVQARRDYVKAKFDENPKLKELERSLASCQSALEDYQSQARHHELGIGVLTGRLTELGGLLHFYAAAKEAQTASRAQHVQHLNTTQEGTQA